MTILIAVPLVWTVWRRNPGKKFVGLGWAMAREPCVAIAAANTPTQLSRKGRRPITSSGSSERRFVIAASVSLFGRLCRWIAPAQPKVCKFSSQTCKAAGMFACDGLLHTATMFVWGDLKYFLAFARAGSMLSAAKALGVNQSTVQRRIS